MCVVSIRVFLDGIPNMDLLGNDAIKVSYVGTYSRRCGLGTRLRDK